MKQLFGDPRFPRENLWSGAAMIGLSSFLVGTILSHLLSSRGSVLDFIALVAVAVALGTATALFRVGLRSVAPDPPSELQPVPGRWARGLLFWLVLVLVPIAIIQFWPRSP